MSNTPPVFTTEGQNSDNIFRALLEHIPAVTYVARPDGAALYISPQIEVLAGFTSTEWVADSQLFLRQVHPEDRERVLAEIERAAHETGSFRCEYRLVARDGRVVWVRDEVSTIPDESGAPLYIQGVVIDISDRKEANAKALLEVARAKVLLHIAARLNTHLDLNALLKTVGEGTAQALNVPAVSITLYNAKHETLDLVAVFGLPSSFVERATPTPRALYDQYTRQMGSIIIFPNIQAMPGLPNSDLYAEFDIRTVVSVGLLRESNLIGNLNLIVSGAERKFTGDELALLQGIADQAASAIMNARLYDENTRQLESLAALYSTARVLSGSLDPARLAGDVTRACVEIFGATLAWLGEIGPNDDQIAMLSQYPRPVSRSQVVHWDEMATRRAIKSQFPVVNTETPFALSEAEKQVSSLADDLQASATIPLISRDRPIGVLGLYSNRKDFFAPEKIELFQAFAHQTAAALENARLFAETTQHLKRVQALREIDMTISTSFDLRVTLDILLEQLTSQLGIDAAAVLRLNPYSQTLEYVTGRGFRTNNILHSHPKLGEGCAGRAALERRRIHIPDLRQAEEPFRRGKLLEGEDFVTYYAEPLIAKGQVKGVCDVFHRAPLNPDPEWLEFLQAVATQAAIAFDNADLFDKLQQSNTNLVLAYDATIESWSRALDRRTQESAGHGQRLADLTIELAEAIGMRDNELAHARRGALLHDIGNMNIPDSILLKPGPLADEEWAIVRQHPALAYEILSTIAYLRPAHDIPYCHHEKWDGSGYPRGLKGEQIPLAARIFAVVDVWDALRSDRPYRPRWLEEKVLAYIREQSGKHFEPQIVALFLQMLEV